MTKKILGDPLTFDRKGHISLDWQSFVAKDQLKMYTNNAVESEHANEEKGWTEFIRQVKDEQSGTDLSLRWWEYRAKSCRDGEEAPLVVCLHEYINTSWQHIADREGFVVLAFEYHRNQRNPEGGLGALGFGPKDDEIISLDIVIDEVVKRHCCDKNRIYLAGLSYGDLMALMYASRYGEKLAGLALINGPASAYNMKENKIIERAVCPIPCIQLRSDDDFTCDGFPAGYAFPFEGNEEWIRHIRSQQAVLNRDVWIKLNECDVTSPGISTEGDKAFITYSGRKCDVIYVEVNKHCHILPVDNAEIIWDRLFSRYRRNHAGEIEEIIPAGENDKVSLAMAAGCDKAYVNGKKLSLGADCLILDPNPEKPGLSVFYLDTETSYSSFYAPAEILRLGFGIDFSYQDAPCVLSNISPDSKVPDCIEIRDGELSFSTDGKDYRLYTNCTLAKVGEKVVSLERPVLWIGRNLMVPICELARLLGYEVSVRNDAVYITDHRFSMGYTFTRLLREEILCDSIYNPIFTAEFNKPEGGTYEYSGTEFRRGDKLVLKPVPKNGYKVKDVKATMNGVSVLVNKISDSEYWVCNVLGNLGIDVEFEKI